MTSRQIALGLAFVISIIISSYVRKNRNTVVAKSIQSKIDTLTKINDSTYVSLELVSIKDTVVLREGVYIQHPKELIIRLSAVSNNIDVDSTKKTLAFQLKSKL